MYTAINLFNRILLYFKISEREYETVKRKKNGKSRFHLKIKEYRLNIKLQ